MPNSHAWSRFYLMGYSFSFCTPLLVLAPAVPAPAHLIKKSVYCKHCMQCSHHPQDTLTLLTPLCKTALRRSLLRNAERDFSMVKEKKSHASYVYVCLWGENCLGKMFVNGIPDLPYFGRAFEGYQVHITA